MSKSPALRRIQADVRELTIDPSDRYHAHPLENDMFEWHFTIRGADGTDFEGGFYHGRILLPAEYPFKPPNIVFLTPSGRFEVNTKVCLSFSAYHPELWQPAWGIRLILEALVSFLPTKGDGAIGALDWTSDERKRLAKKSVDYCCPVCGKCSDILKQIEKRIASKGSNWKKGGKPSRFEKEIEHLVAMQMASHDGDTKTTEKGDDNENVEEKEKTEAAADNEDDVKCIATGEAESDAVVEETKDIVSDTDPKPITSIDAETEEVVGEACADSTLPDATTRSRDIKISKTDESGRIEPVVTEVEKEATAEESGNNIDAPNAPDDIVDESQEERLQSPLLSDPVVHAGIAIFSIIVWLLVRKLNAIIVDMKGLEAELRELK